VVHSPFWGRLGSQKWKGARLLRTEYSYKQRALEIIPGYYYEYSRRDYWSKHESNESSFIQ
jgi:hypothetical protein